MARSKVLHIYIYIYTYVWCKIMYIIKDWCWFSAVGGYSWNSGVTVPDWPSHKAWLEQSQDVNLRVTASWVEKDAAAGGKYKIALRKKYDTEQKKHNIYIYSNIVPMFFAWIILLEHPLFAMLSPSREEMLRNGTWNWSCKPRPVHSCIMLYTYCHKWTQQSNCIQFAHRGHARGWNHHFSSCRFPLLGHEVLASTEGAGAVEFQAESMGGGTIISIGESNLPQRLNQGGIRG